MMKKSSTPRFKHKKRVIRTPGPPESRKAVSERPPLSLNGKIYSNEDMERVIAERMRDIEQRVDRINRSTSQDVGGAKPKKRRPSRGSSDAEDAPRSSHKSRDIEPLLLAQLKELTHRMDALQTYGSVSNLNLSPRGKNQFLSNFTEPPSPNHGYHSDGDPDIRRSMPGIQGRAIGFPNRALEPLYGLGNGPSNTNSYDNGHKNKLSPSFRLERDDVRQNLAQQNMDLQTALQETRNEYLRAMSMLETETFERQQLERRTQDLSNKLAASRQALAVTQTALSGLQEAQQESGRTRDVRDIEIEKYLTEIKIKDSKLQGLESRLKDFDDHMNMNLSKKDETIQKLQKKLTDALDTAYKAENDASTISKDLSIAEQEVYSLRNRLSHADLDHAEAMKKLEKEYKEKIEALNQSLSKALASQEQSDKNVLRSATLEAKNIEVEARVRYLDSVVLKLERENHLKTEEVRKVQTDLAALMHEKSLSANSLTLELEDRIKQLEKNANEFTEREASLISERNQLQGECKHFKKRIEELSDNGANPVIKELEYSKGLLEKENDHLKRQHAALEQELNSVKRTLRDNEEQNSESLKKQISSKEDQIRQLYNDLKSAKDEIHQLSAVLSNRSNGDSNALLDGLRAERDGLAETNRKLETEVLELRQQGKSHKSTMVEKNNEILNLTLQLQELNDPMSLLADSHSVEISELRSQLQERAVDRSRFQSESVESEAHADTELSNVPDNAVADEESEVVPKEKRKKSKSKKKKSTKRSKSRSTVGSNDHDNEQEEREQEPQEASQDQAFGDPPILEGTRESTAVDTRKPTPPSEDTGRHTPFRRAGFSAEAEKPQATPALTPSSAFVVGEPKIPLPESRPSSNAPLNNIFSTQISSMSPAVGQRKVPSSPAARSVQGSAGLDRGVSASSSVERQSYNLLKSGTSGSVRSHVSLNAEDLRRELAELNTEKKRLKKQIGKWNTDFLLAHNREPGVEDKSNDNEITELYQLYHEVSMRIKTTEELLDSLKIFK